MEAETTQQLSETISQASNASRRLRGTVIVQASQTERERLETRTVTNHNHCHALSILYYEILRHYCVTTRAAREKDVIFISYQDRLIENFDLATIREHRQILIDTLLSDSLLECLTNLPKESDLTAMPPPEPMLIQRLWATTRVPDGVEGAESDDNALYLRLLKSDLTMVWGIRDERARFTGEYENGGYASLGVDLDPPLPLHQIRRIGLAMNHGGDDLTLQNLMVDAVDTMGNAFSIYQNDDIRMTFRGDDEWWSDPLNLNSSEPTNESQREFLSCFQKLRDHLNANTGYYSRRIWLSEDPDVRAMRFDQFMYLDGRLTDYILNQPIAVYGNYLGFAVGEFEDIDSEAVKPIERIVSLPTRGAFAEAKLSDCNACEERDITRLWDWSESPCPQKAPEITGVTPGSRAQDINADLSEMPSGIVNVVNPPAAPDPTGLAAALQLLATSNIFRDMSAREQLASVLNELTKAAAGTSSDIISNIPSGDANSGSGSRGGTGSRTTSTGAAQPTAREIHDYTQTARAARERGQITPQQEQDLVYRRLTDGVNPAETLLAQNDSGSLSTYLPSRSGPVIQQARLLLKKFAVNDWNLTDEHLEGLNQFVRLLNNSVTYEILLIEGRASNTGPESERDVTPSGEGPGNIELSRLRANSVAQYLLGRGLITPGNVPRLEAHGSSSPLVPAEGEVDINRSVLVSYTYAAELPEPDPIPLSTIPDPIISRRWSITIDFSGGIHAIVGGWSGSGRLKNLETGEVFDIWFLVLGLRVGVSTPGGYEVDEEDFEEFSTIEAVPAIAFHKRYCLIGSATFGSGLAGGSATFINIPDFATGEIQIGSFSMGNIGADLSAGILGVMYLKESGADRARQELREYNHRVEEYNRRMRGE